MNTSVEKIMNTINNFSHFIFRPKKYIKITAGHNEQSKAEVILKKENKTGVTADELIHVTHEKRKRIQKY